MGLGETDAVLIFQEASVPKANCMHQPPPPPQPTKPQSSIPILWCISQHTPKQTGFCLGAAVARQPILVAILKRPQVKEDELQSGSPWFEICRNSFSGLSQSFSTQTKLQTGTRSKFSTTDSLKYLDIKKVPFFSLATAFNSAGLFLLNITAVQVCHKIQGI